MTNASEALRNPQAGSDVAPLRAKSWGKFLPWVLFGVLHIITGLGRRRVVA